jgi:two-component system chemotaxis response regulator CheB
MNAVGHDIIVIGASAGGVQALREICKQLPADLPAAVFVVIHTAPTSPGMMPQILDRSGPLPALFAGDGDPIRRGAIFIAPPDRHLLIKDGTMRVTRGPKENGFRPACDPLFRTAARWHGPRVVGVVLSGGLDDGTEGLMFVKQYGGIAIAQDPVEADFPSMPASAIQNVEVDHVLPVKKIAELLVRLAHEPAPPHPEPVAGDGAEMDVAEMGDASLKTKDLPGNPSPFVCPECGGATWELHKGKLVKYRCHVGHSYTAEGMLARQSEELEAALWQAMRALEENAALRRRMASRSASQWPSIADSYEKQAEEADHHAEVIRRVLLDQQEAMNHAEEQKQRKGKRNGMKSRKAARKAVQK